MALENRELVVAAKIGREADISLRCEGRNAVRVRGLCQCQEQHGDEPEREEQEGMLRRHLRENDCKSYSVCFAPSRLMFRDGRHSCAEERSGNLTAEHQRQHWMPCCETKSARFGEYQRCRPRAQSRPMNQLDSLSPVRRQSRQCFFGRMMTLRVIPGRALFPTQNDEPQKSFHY